MRRPASTRRLHRTTATLAGALLLSSGALAGCGGSGDSGGSDADAEPGGDGDSFSAAADTSTCAADATALDAPYGEGFPADFTFPPRTVVFGREDRGDAGVIITGVSTAPFADVLDYLNEQERAAGYTITDGETEEDDAEATFSVTGQTGRWAIKKSASCDGETVVQVVAFPTGQ